MDVKPGYKQTEVGVIPEDWKILRLSNLFEFSNGVNGNKSAYGKGISFINVLEVITHEHLTARDIPGRVSLARSAMESYAVRRGDLVFNRTSETQDEVGLAAVYADDEPVVFGGFVIRGRPTTANLDVTFSGYAFRAPSVRSQIVARGQGAVRANVGQSDLKQVLVALPPITEQQAIAEALSDTDALIESLEQLVAKIRLLKQGAMQELLTGKRRLPGFDREWDQSTVGREFDIQLGKMLDSQKNRGVQKPYLGNRAVQWGKIDISELPTMAMSPADLERYRLRRGDLLVCEGGEVGRAAIWQAPIPECYYQKALHRLRPLRWFNTYLMVALFQYWTEQSLLTDYISQTSIAHLTREKLADVPLRVPPSDEQSAIAAVLSDMDAEIDALEAKLAKARQLKQGMMQELLTGRIRLV